MKEIRREDQNRIRTYIIQEEMLKEYLTGAMEEWGIPTELYDTYEEIVLDKWDTQMRSYITLVDFTSPDYREAAKKYNNKLKQVRTAMTQTEKGRETLARMKSEGHDDGTTIPIPAFEGSGPIEV